tara:strand:+ start:2856 stop:3266 length:411 start_codon:yes stop_codon:yes gene_type:complete
MSDNNNSNLTHKPPKQELLEELRDQLSQEVERNTEQFNDVQMPVAFATLENDVKHLWRYFILLSTILIAIIGYFANFHININGEISSLVEKINIGTVKSQALDSKVQSIEGRLERDIDETNDRVDNIIIKNGNNNW